MHFNGAYAHHILKPHAQIWGETGQSGDQRHKAINTEILKYQ